MILHKLLRSTTLYLNKAKFITSMSKYNEIVLEDMPQIAVVGKSNVGKSSFINCITNNSKLCKVGQTPGKTRLVNFFSVEDSFYLVDLPGYGYAKRSKKELIEWSSMVEGYLRNSSKLMYIIMLVDIRHKPTQDDMNMFNWICHFEKQPIVICTKADKLAKTKRIPVASAIGKQLGFNGKVLPIDSCSGYGRDIIVGKLKEII